MVPKIDPKYRLELIEELYQRYGRAIRMTGSWHLRFRFFWKKYSWLFIVGGTVLAKRIVDVIVSSISLLILSPLMGLTALLIRLHDRGPILYWQTRVGQWGKEFRFPKFRSMSVQAEDLTDLLKDQAIYKEDVTFKSKEDPRMTPIGKFIRKASIDELPQLWNVFKGEMSLVGPRPPLPNEVARYSLKDRRRLDVKPGLTCYWQVSGRSDLSFQKQVELDIAYIESRSLWLDFKILLKTIPAVLSGKGAY